MAVQTEPVFGVTRKYQSMMKVAVVMSKAG